MNTFQKTFCASLLLATTVCSAPLWAREDKRDLAVENNKANSLLRSGDVEAAIGAYQQAQSLEPNSAELSYNLAVAKYRKGDVSAAEQLFRVASAADNDATAAKARYNLGNCDYAAALKSAKNDRPGAIKGLESAIANYRGALRIDPSDTDARANIELAANLIEKLREQEKDQQQHNQSQQNHKQQSQQQSGKSGDSKDKQSSPEQQQQSGNQSKGEQSAHDKANSQQQSSKESAQKDHPQQSKPDRSNPPKLNESSDNKGSPKQQDANSQRPQSQQTGRSQSANKRKNDNPSPQTQQPSEKRGKSPPKGSLTAAGQMDQSSATQEKQPPAEYDPARDGEMTLQEAEKMLQAIRDREMLRRLQRQAAERDRHVPVDRDW